MCTLAKLKEKEKRMNNWQTYSEMTVSSLEITSNSKTKKF